MQKRHFIIVAAIFAAAILIVSIVTVTMSNGNGQNETEVYIQDSGREKSSTDPYCLLVIGKDRAAGLTDVIMLVSFDIENERISVMQIPRDTYADYGDGKHNKLNSALASLGSAKKLKSFFEKSFCISIDGYLTLDLDAFRDIVDAVGGVEIELDRALYYNDPAQKLYIDLPAGKQRLDGRQAEKYVRYRSGYAGGDIDRLDAQKSFLSALFLSLKEQINADNAYSVASALIGKVDTDVSLSMAVALGLKAISVDNSRLLFCTLPGEAAISPKSGASYYVMSQKPTQKILGEYFNCRSTQIDNGQNFVCSKYESFVKIYEKDKQVVIISAEDLK